MANQNKFFEDFVVVVVIQEKVFLLEDWLDTKGSIGNITLSVLKKSSHKLPAASTYTLLLQV